MGFLSGLFGRREKAPRATRVVRARYDAAKTTPDNAKHWANADGLSALAAHSPTVRRQLRNRARYEVANNSYAKGIVLTIANDTIGTGPRLQLLTETPEVNARIEREFDRWATRIGLPEKLRVMRAARVESGEAFIVLTRNDAIPGPIKLDVRVLEAEQVASPNVIGDDLSDGILYDKFGNPSAYSVLRRHPGDGAGTLTTDADLVPASNVIHYYRAERPGQARGVPELTPALPLFAQLRRYTLAVLAAAETAADYAGVVYTDAPPGGEAEDVAPLDTIEIEARSLLTMPAGWKIGQMKAEQPVTAYGEFKNQILNEIARCLNMPFNVAAGNSSNYNYSSGRLDHQTYHKALKVDQQQICDTVLERILVAWMREAILVSGLVPPQMRQMDWPHTWFFDGVEHVDPLKEAQAASVRLQSGCTTLATEYARQGKDWEAELRQRARELALMEELGMVTVEEAPAGPAEESETE